MLMEGLTHGTRLGGGKMGLHFIKPYDIANMLWSERIEICDGRVIIGRT